MASRVVAIVEDLAPPIIRQNRVSPARIRFLSSNYG
jgi:hypothetical protein